MEKNSITCAMSRLAITKSQGSTISVTERPANSITICGFGPSGRTSSTGWGLSWFKNRTRLSDLPTATQPTGRTGFGMPNPRVLEEGKLIFILFKKARSLSNSLRGSPSFICEGFFLFLFSAQGSVPQTSGSLDPPDLAPTSPVPLPNVLFLVSLHSFSQAVHSLPYPLPGLSHLRRQEEVMYHLR